MRDSVSYIRLLVMCAISGWVLGCEGEPSDAERLLTERVEKLEKEAAAIEDRAARAKEEALFFECKTTNERILSEAAHRKAACLYEMTSQAECRAQNSENAVEGTIWGCLFGIAAAAVSGGAAAPIALSGCGIGYAMADEEPCPTPECTERMNRLVEDVLGEEELDFLPMCGGRLGISIAPRNLHLKGVVRVVNAGALSVAGLKEGDLIAYVNDERVRTPSEVVSRIKDHRREVVKFKFVRDGRIFEGGVTLNNLPHGEFVAEDGADHQWGVVVQDVKAAGTLPVATGDRLVSIDGKEIATVEQAQTILRYRREGETVSLVIDPPAGDKKTVVATLGKRDGARDL